MSKHLQRLIGALSILGALSVGCAKADLDLDRGRITEEDDIEASGEDSATEPESDSQPNPSEEKETEESAKDSQNESQPTNEEETQDDTGPSPAEDSSCGALQQGCCGEGLCDDESLVCVGGWPDEASSSCVPMCNGTFCNTTEGEYGACYPTSDPTMTYCDGGTENPPAKTCGASVTCPAGSECLVETAGATQGKCFKTGCDPYSNCTGPKDLCIPLVDADDQPTGYGACLTLL